MVVRNQRCTCALEPGLLTQDRAVQPLQSRVRLDPELVDERPAGVEVRPERLGLPARPVEREHELAPGTLAQGVVADERFDLTDELGASSLLEIRVDAFLQRVQA